MFGDHYTQEYTPYYARKRTVMPGEKCWRCGKPMPVESIGNPLWLYRSDERTFRGQSIMRLFCSAACMKKYTGGGTRVATVCKYCGKDLPREYAPGERSEFSMVMKGGRKCKDGTSKDRVQHFCSAACIEWKLYNDKIARVAGKMKAGSLGSVEALNIIDTYTKPKYDDPMSAVKASSTASEPVEENVDNDATESAEDATEAVQTEEPTTEQECENVMDYDFRLDFDKVENEDGTVTIGTIMPTGQMKPAYRRMKLTPREFDLSGDYVSATIICEADGPRAKITMHADFDMANSAAQLNGYAAELNEVIQTLLSMEEGTFNGL